MSGERVRVTGDHQDSEPDRCKSKAADKQPAAKPIHAARVMKLMSAQAWEPVP